MGNTRYREHRDTPHTFVLYLFAGVSWAFSSRHGGQFVDGVFITFGRLAGRSGLVRVVLVWFGSTVQIPHNLPVLLFSPIFLLFLVHNSFISQESGWAIGAAVCHMFFLLPAYFFLHPVIFAAAVVFFV